MDTPISKMWLEKFPDIWRRFRMAVEEARDEKAWGRAVVFFQQVRIRDQEEEEGFIRHFLG